MSGQLLLLSCFVEIPELNANSEDPDQTPRSAASDLGLHCLPMSLLWDARLKWVNVTTLMQIMILFSMAFKYDMGTRLCFYLWVGQDNVSLGWPAVVQLLIFISSGTQ